MALDIEGATVGYDSAGVKQLMTDIQAHVIEEAAGKLTANLTTLDTAIDDCWAGRAAEVFKTNMEKDVNAIKDALNQAYGSLSAEVSQIVSQMGQVDQELVQSR